MFGVGRMLGRGTKGHGFREGNFALAEVKYAAGDIKPMVIESVGTAQVRACAPSLECADVCVR